MFLNQYRYYCNAVINFDYLLCIVYVYNYDLSYTLCRILCDICQILSALTTIFFCHSFCMFIEAFLVPTGSFLWCSKPIRVYAKQRFLFTHC